MFRNRLLFLLAYCLLTSICHNAYADGKQPLPRAYGPITLGMSVENFKKIASVHIGRCVECAKEELHAVLIVDENTAKFYGVFPIMLSNGLIKHQPPTLQPEKMTCVFYKGILYRIVLEDVKETMVAVKERYVKALGKPIATDVWDTGLSQLGWVRFPTSLRLMYTTNEKGADSMLIIYEDLKIMKQVPQPR